MAKTFEFKTANGQGINVQVKGKNLTITSNGENVGTYKVKSSFFTGLEDDVTINVGGEEYIVAVRGNKSIRLAKDGRYIDDGSDFHEVVPAPKWVTVFHVLNWAIVVISFGGAIPAGLSALGSFGCANIAKSSKPIGLKLVLCILLTVAMWAVFISMAMATL